MKQLPVYKLVLSEDLNNSTGLSTISFVKEPAIEETFVYFSKDEPTEIKFSIQEDRQIITGPALIPNMRIERNIPEPHYVYIDKEGIELTVKKFFKMNRIGNVNAEHTSLLLSGVYPFESFISDASRGINPPSQFKDLPDGTLFLSYSIESPEIWKQVKNGTFNGFSIEGGYNMLEVKMSKIESSEDQDQLDLYNLFSSLY